jgi:hypothetical protein
MPVVIFGMVLASAMMIAALLTADDETRAARAMRESSAAFYAAEAGLNEVYATWDSIDTAVDALQPGQSLSLDWRTLASGARYRATVNRYDHAGAQPIYQLEVEGRGPGQLSGQKVLSLALTAAPGGPGSGYRLGECCGAAATVRGAVDLEDMSYIEGRDMNPGAAGSGWYTHLHGDGWGDACDDVVLQDKPGLIMKDTTQLRFNDPTPVLEGVPPLVENADLSDATWDSLGDHSWSDLKGQATKFFDDGEFSPRPSVTVDPLTGELVCNTADPLNLGSPDPNHPCFDYFPIVLVNDDVTFDNGYAQGIFVLDWDESTHAGSEFDLEIDFTLAGLILGKGCVEPEENSRVYGAIFVDAEYRNYDICNSDYDYDMNDGDPRVQYSTCAIDRAIVNGGLMDWAEVTVPGEPGGVQRLGMRSFGEPFR